MNRVKQNVALKALSYLTAVFFVFQTVAIAESNAPSSPPEYQRFYDALLSDQSCLQSQPLSLIDSPGAEYSTRVDKNYLELLSNYKGAFEKLRGAYPDGVLHLQTARVLRPFFGSRQMYSFTPSAYPYFLFYTDAFPGIPGSYEKLKASCGGEPVYGLRVRTAIHDYYYSEDEQHPISDFLYISDLNARVFGFTHAQLVEGLSRGVRTARHFRYNGILPWSKHRRYKQEDQIRVPIELTNFGHSSQKTSFLESDHPDFALEVSANRKEDIVLTFFLWREEGSLFGAAKKYLETKGKPDFIYQLVLRPHPEPVQPRRSGKEPLKKELMNKVR